MKTKFFFLIFLAAPFSQAKIQSGIVQVSPVRSVAYELEIFDSGKPTLILLPGIFRGLLPKVEKELFQKLAEEKINWVTLHFAGHPLSVVLAEGKNATLANVTLDDMASDVEEVIEELEIESPIPVSLSYSSAPASKFAAKNFPLLIETAPMTKQVDDDPAAEKKSKEDRKNLEAGCFFQPLCIDYWMNFAYRQHWAGEIPRQQKRHKELQNPLLAMQLVDGYVGMARAIENWSLMKTNFKGGPERIFILGEDENVHRLSDQVKVLRAYKNQRGEWPLVFLLQKAGHIVPEDQPKAFVKVISLILKNKVTNRVSYVKTNGVVLPLSEKEFEKILDDGR